MVGWTSSSVVDAAIVIVIVATDVIIYIDPTVVVRVQKFSGICSSCLQLA